MLTNAQTRTIEERLGSNVRSCTPLQGGCVAAVFRVELGDGRRLAVKACKSPENEPLSTPGGGFDIEGRMLAALTETGVVRVPVVLIADPDLLVMEYVDHDGRKTPAGEAELADRLTDLHSFEPAADMFGFDTDTRIGGLVQVNTPERSWPRFYARHRLLDMGRRADARGALPAGTLDRLGSLADRIDDALAGCATGPSLIHGDLWAGNVLWDRGSPAALIDPAVYHADPEVELAFIDLMGGMGRPFWYRYERRRAIAPGFWERRRPVYQLYPLLVHAVLFGGGYGASVAATLDAIAD